MEKEINPVGCGIYAVTAEPGDSTRYSYFVYRDGPDNFRFMSRRNEFAYPQDINFWDIANLNDFDLFKRASEIADKSVCNPHTVMECIRTVKQLHGVQYG